MGKYKICVYAICKNERQFIDRWVDSMSESDCIAVTDTGSADGTVEALRRRGVDVYRETVSPWRFDGARNLSLSHVPQDCDICVSTDLDEVFEPGWRQKLENSWTNSATRAVYHYTWSFTGDGSPGVTFMYDRIHARRGYKWDYPAHECLTYNGTGPEVVVSCPDVRLCHYPDSGKDRGYYLPLLEMTVAEYPDSPRGYFYLGREFWFNSRWDECISALITYLTLSSWAPERSAAMRYIARACGSKGELQNQRSWLLRAAAETPGLREPYYELVLYYYRQQDWASLHCMVALALKIKARSSFINEPECWDHSLYDYDSIALFNLGMYPQSLQAAQTALELNPEDRRIAANLEIIRQAVEAATAAISKNLYSQRGMP